MPAERVEFTEGFKVYLKSSGNSTGTIRNP